MYNKNIFYALHYILFNIRHYTVVFHRQKPPPLENSTIINHRRDSGDPTLRKLNDEWRRDAERRVKRSPPTFTDNLQVWTPVP